MKEKYRKKTRIFVELDERKNKSATVFLVKNFVKGKNEQKKRIF